MSRLADTLQNWAILNRDLKLMSEDKLRELMMLETNGKKRLNFLLRIHSRLNLLRAQRERLELMQKVGQ